MTPAHVSSRYHQSLRNQLICKGTVVPTDGAKLMVFFLSKLGWSLLESLGRSVGSDRYATYTKTVVRRGVRRPPLRCLSHFLSYDKERDQLLMVS